jgi:hypothetical protein
MIVVSSARHADGSTERALLCRPNAYLWKRFQNRENVKNSPWKEPNFILKKAELRVNSLALQADIAGMQLKCNSLGEIEPDAARPSHASRPVFQ